MNLDVGAANFKIGPPDRTSWHERALMRWLARWGWTHRELAQAFGRAGTTIARHVVGIWRPSSVLNFKRVRAENAKLRREWLRERWLCIECSSPTGAHPPMIKSPCRCERCAERHRQ